MKILIACTVLVCAAALVGWLQRECGAVAGEYDVEGNPKEAPPAPHFPEGWTLGEPEGLVKTIFDAKTGQLLGAHMVGAEVTELIQGFVIAMNLETTEEELMHTIFPHPTLSEMMKEAVLDAYGRVLNM